MHTVMHRQQLLRHLSWGMQLQRCYMQKRGWGKASALVAHNRDADAAAIAATPKGCSNSCKICSHTSLPVVDDVARAKRPSRGENAPTYEVDCVGPGRIGTTRETCSC